jgi:hypothetical protein
LLQFHSELSKGDKHIQHSIDLYNCFFHRILNLFYLYCLHQMVFGILGSVVTTGILGGGGGGGGGVLGGIPIVGDLLGGNNNPPPPPSVEQQCAENRSSQGHAASTEESSQRSCCLGRNVHHTSGQCSYTFTCNEIGLFTDIGSASCRKYRGDYCDTRQKVLHDRNCKEYCKKPHSGCMRNTADHVKQSHCLNNPSEECACINFKPTNEADRDMLRAMSPTDLGPAGNPACFASVCKGTEVYHLDKWWQKDGSGNRTVPRCRAVTICSIDVQNTSMDASDRANIIIQNKCGQDSVAVGGRITVTESDPATDTGSSSETMTHPNHEDDNETDSDMYLTMMLSIMCMIAAGLIVFKKIKRRKTIN